MNRPTLLLPLVTAVGLLAACAGQQSGAGTQPSSQHAAAPTAPTPPAAASQATAAPSLSCTTSGPASATWRPAPSRPVGLATITATAAGDTLTLRFDQGTPAFQVRTQASPRFSRDPSGQPLTLAGAAGVSIVLSGFRGDTRNYTGPPSLSPDGQLLREVQEIGDFEGVVTWGAGLSEPGCANVTSDGSTLTIRLIRQAQSARATEATVAAVEAVANRVYAGEYRMGCTMYDTSCPLTARLAARVFATRSPNAVGPGPIDAFCRCQNPASRAMSVAGEVTPAGGVAHVALYPDVHAIKIDLIIVVQDGQLLVDDMRCTGGGPSTSVYAAQLALCG